MSCYHFCWLAHDSPRRPFHRRRLPEDARSGSPLSLLHANCAGARTNRTTPTRRGAAEMHKVDGVVIT